MEWISVVEYYWQRRGVPPSERERLGSALRHALDTSLAQGFSVDELIAVDPSHVARHATSSEVLGRQLRWSRPRTPWSSVLTGLLGAAIGGLLALAVWYPLGSALMAQLALSVNQQVLFGLGLHTGTACIVTASIIGTLRWRFRFHRRVRPLAAFTGLLVLFGAAVGVFPAALVSANGGYSIQAPALFTQAAIGLAMCAASLLVARWILTRAGVRQ